LILLDTHVVLWLAFEQHRISRTAREAIDDSRNKDKGLAISSITLLEIAVLAGNSRIRLNSTLESFLQEVERRFIVLQINSQACARTAELPANYPKDPADRIIGTTAMVEGIPLLTADREIRISKAVRVIW
jgi:PIN domain nuclease of toxin-antitoxin system